METIKVLFEGVAWLEWFRAASDLIKACLWPAVVVCALRVFRQPVSDFIGRVRKVSGRVGENEIQLDTAQVAAEEKRRLHEAKIDPPDLPVPPNNEAENKPLTIPYDFDGIQGLEAELAKAVEVIPVEFRLSMLTRALAQTRLERYFEVIFGQIFGSQISFLNNLSVKTNVTEIDAARYYEEHVRQINPNVFTAENYALWISFLEQWDLVRRVNGSIAVTPLGWDFLKFLHRNKQGSSRPL